MGGSQDSEVVDHGLPAVILCSVCRHLVAFGRNISLEDGGDAFLCSVVVTTYKTVIQPRRQNLTRI
jgi:hypothetical protein